MKRVKREKSLKSGLPARFGQWDESTAVDDVRRVRAQIAAQHQGDLRAHMEETNQIFAELRVRLNLKVSAPRKK